MSDTATGDRHVRPGWVCRLAHFPVTRILLYLGGIGATLWLLGLTHRRLAAGLGAWWPGSGASVVLSSLAVHFVYRGITRVAGAEARDRVRPTRRNPRDESSPTRERIA